MKGWKSVSLADVPAGEAVYQKHQHNVASSTPSDGGSAANTPDEDEEEEEGIIEFESEAATRSSAMSRVSSPAAATSVRRE